MSFHPCTVVSLARSVAIAALLSAPLMAAPLATFAAEPNTASPSSSTAANTAVEQQITQLHAELKITPDQESKWNPVAQAMRDNAANLQKLMSDRQRQGTPNMSAVDDLETNQKFVQVHLDGLKSFTSAFKSLYDSMSDQQKKNADQVFARMNRPQGAPANHNG